MDYINLHPNGKLVYSFVEKSSWQKNCQYGGYFKCCCAILSLINSFKILNIIISPIYDFLKIFGIILEI